MNIYIYIYIYADTRSDVSSLPLREEHQRPIGCESWYLCLCVGVGVRVRVCVGVGGRVWVWKRDRDTASRTLWKRVSASPPESHFDT